MRTPAARILVYISAATLLVLAVAYVGSYNYLPDNYYHDFSLRADRVIVRRDYPQQWQKTIFSPLGRIEALVRGVPVEIGGPDDDQ